MHNVYYVQLDIIGCRTEWLGGRIQKCTDCGREVPLYNSRRNRHCPKCQSMAKERWLEKRKSEVPPFKYFHNVFTVPHELNPVILCNKRVAINILFKTVSETPLRFGANPDNGPGGKLGFIAFPHTRDQALLDHFHVHIIVPAGALSADGESGIACECDWLFPERVLSKVLRGKFMFHLQKACDNAELAFPGNTPKYGTSRGFQLLKNALRSKTWVVDVEPPLDKPERVIDFVGRYTHRVAISNRRILDLSDGKVAFSYKNREKGTAEAMKIDAVEFIRRFLSHTLPKGPMRIRYCGFLSNRCKRECLKKCRKSLGVSHAPIFAEPETVGEIMMERTGRDITKCPFRKKGDLIPCNAFRPDRERVRSK